jgi:hypothetical protein|tara:strand:- start:8437 stop:8898 length:462 start_codon:yes stop_codon:yes gene_type:complete
MYHKLNLPALDLPDVWYTDKVQVESKVGGYISYYVTDEVDAQIRSIFPKDFFPEKTHILAQLIDPRLNGVIHMDKREFAINYVLNKGGLDAHTSVYSGDKVLESTYTQHEKEWYLLNTFKNHAVHNITDTRVAISISFYEFGDAQWQFIKTLL